MSEAVQVEELQRLAKVGLTPEVAFGMLRAMKRELKLDEDGIPMAPSQADWDAMTQEEREWVMATLPGSSSTATQLLAQGDDLPKLLEELIARRVEELWKELQKDTTWWRRSTGWRERPGVVVRRRAPNNTRLRAARPRSAN
ncbi:hypothetical protein JY651_41780 [Pyxidicoccus parkwayensis]|uniref:Uncharacterized protein n=1 Tax=Pyxidicoccus parkwayensis TaxID=2813578 RepID=A0ABX7NS83_9BACT|nr:hypothetical protein [Pyxidicoccus parkwaysis]QSQ21635.1 hypothetical protein JY651_41780 [Pyxidicoccus parkwaysis]